MTDIEKAQMLHTPEGREPPGDPDLIRWAEALPQAAALIEETQYLRREVGRLEILLWTEEEGAL